MQLRAPAATSMAIHDPGKKISNRTICAALQTMIGIAPKFEVERYFVHHTVANKITLDLEFRRTFAAATFRFLQKVVFCTFSTFRGSYE